MWHDLTYSRRSPAPAGARAAAIRIQWEVTGVNRPDQRDQEVAGLGERRAAPATDVICQALALETDAFFREALFRGDFGGLRAPTE